MKRNSLILAVMTILPFFAVTTANAATLSQQQVSTGSDSTRLTNLRTLVNWTATSVVTKLVNTPDPQDNGGWSPKNLRNPPASEQCAAGQISYENSATYYVIDENVPFYSRHHKTCCSSPAVCGACVSGSNPDWSPSVAPSAESNQYPWRTWLWMYGCDGTPMASSATSAPPQFSGNPMLGNFSVNYAKGYNPNNPQPFATCYRGNQKFWLAEDMGCGSGSCSLTNTLDPNNPTWFRYGRGSGNNSFKLVLSRTCYTVTWAPTS